MMLKLYESLPFLPELPLIDSSDNTIMRTINNIPGIKYKDKKILLPNVESATFEKSLNKLDSAYNSSSNLEHFSFDAPFFNIYNQMLQRIKPHFTTVKLLGPFSFAELVYNQSSVNLFNDKLYRKFLIQAFVLKANWFISKVQSLSSDTKVLILYDEPLLYNFSNLKREEELANDAVVSLLSKVYQKIHSIGGFVGVQSFNKCNWQLPIDAGADLLSFDAYNNPNNLSIIAESVNNFLINGGYINWGIVPVTNESTIKSINLDYIESKFKSVSENLADEGIAYKMLLRHSTVSVQGDLAKIPILHAEKALILSQQLSDKVSHF